MTATTATPSASLTTTSTSLTIANYTGTWYYRANAAPHAACSSAVSGTSETISGLTSGTSYTYRAYADSTCAADSLLATAAALHRPVAGARRRRALCPAPPPVPSPLEGEGSGEGIKKHARGRGPRTASPPAPSPPLDASPPLAASPPLDASPPDAALARGSPSPPPSFRRKPESSGARQRSLPSPSPPRAGDGAGEGSPRAGAAREAATRRGGRRRGAPPPEGMGKERWRAPLDSGFRRNDGGEGAGFRGTLATMTTADQPADATRDYGSPATWGDIERVRLSLEKQMADLRADMSSMETRLTRLILGARSPAPSPSSACSSPSSKPSPDAGAALASPSVIPVAPERLRHSGESRNPAERASAPSPPPPLPVRETARERGRRAQRGPRGGDASRRATVRGPAPGGEGEGALARSAGFRLSPE